MNVTNMWPFSYASGQTYSVLTPVVSTLALCYLVFNIFKWAVGDLTVPIRDISKHHNWKSIRVTAKTWYCSLCESLLMSGFGAFCDCCGVCADQDCIKKVDSTLPCKVLTSIKDNLEHHWVKGNLPLGSSCSVCCEDCSMEPGLVDYQCCWCHRCVHASCLKIESKICDLGPFRSLIVPPWCVQTARRKSSVRRHLLLRSVKDPEWSDWTPLIVVGNKKAGNGDGGIILSKFRHMLNPAQVLDLSERSPAAALQWCCLVAPRTCKLVSAGGDGTVAWMLNTIHKMQLKPVPPVSIIPLGTGNDLSRILGWGKEHSADLNVTKYLEQILKAESKQLDRWRVDITPYRHLGLRMPVRMMYMYNYFSIGVDAQIALDFHRTRESKLYLFSNRIFNKILYMCFGTQQVVAAGCRNLEQRIEVFLDGKKAELPEIEALVVLNIPSWGAGVNLWGINTNDENSSQSISDGKLEVVGISSSFQMAQFQVGLSQPYRLGQAESIEIRLLGSSAVQIDGEPWEQHPALFKICATEPATVLVNQG